MSLTIMVYGRFAFSIYGIRRAKVVVVVKGLSTESEESIIFVVGVGNCFGCDIMGQRFGTCSIQMFISLNLEATIYRK